MLNAVASRATPGLVHSLVGAGGAAVGGTAGIVLVLGWEILWARKRVMSAQRHSAPRSSGIYGAARAGEPLEMALLGDSLAVGLGADTAEQTVGALLATELAAAAHRPVRLHNVAVIGAESRDLPAQIEVLKRETDSLDVAVIVIGANDVMHFQRTRDAVRWLAAAVHQLRGMQAQVVVATCPDMGTVRPLFQPLRFLGHWRSRLLATTQTIVVLRAGGRTVSLADTLGTIFSSQPNLMFSTDSLHPSSLGYARAAQVLLPSVCAAAGCWTHKDSVVPHRVHTKGRKHPLAFLAFRASRQAGIEVSGGTGRNMPTLTAGRRWLIHGGVRPGARPRSA